MYEHIDKLNKNLMRIRKKEEEKIDIIRWLEEDTFLINKEKYDYKYEFLKIVLKFDIKSTLKTFFVPACYINNHCYN
jgi:hypothetical protein